MTVCYVMDNSSKELYALEAFKRAMKAGENNCNLVKLVSIIINKLDFDNMFKHCVIHK